MSEPLVAGVGASTPLQSVLGDPTLVPAGLIVLPIVAAAVALAAGQFRERSGWPVALAALVLEAALAGRLVAAVFRGDGRLVHELGAYGRPDGIAVGIELVADELSTLVVALVAVVALGVLAVARSAGPRGSPFYAAYLLLSGGLMGVALTGDVFNLFVFLEIVGLSTYTLVAADRSARSAVAALKYLIVGTTGASLYLVGVGYLFLATGTLNMVDLADVLGTEVAYTDLLVVASFGFVAVGLLVKAAIFPLHTWQPDAYDAAPDAVTVYISALVSTLGVYAFARLALTVYTPAFFEAVPIAATAVVTLGAISIVAGSALAVTQSRAKRLFAYSSVSQFGLIVAAVGIAVHPSAPTSAARAALIGAVVHLVGHALIKGGLFAAAAGLARDAGARRVREYAGLGRDSPALAGATAVLGLSLVGVPPSVGFLAKWYVAVGAIDAGLWPLATVIVASTLFTLAYVARVLERLYFTPPDRTSTATGAVAADGGALADGGRTDGDEADAGGDPAADGPPGAPLGIVLVAVVVALSVVVLGFGGAELAAALDPFLTEVIGA